ncbi:MAG: MMPL family transporter [Marinospirillum sp.]|uniref:efflux RND transporter permease subunit n=1 Tax=Marinospirillum sp. TaxID=2183934 RepID=UPI0019FC12B8|nr:MMPL family transporter [Marinospirillum sp.]MBE0508310.1 MMPL family transporter [Marinospirillum sp.]
MGKQLAFWCMNHTRTVFIAVLVMTIALGLMIPKIIIDTDPENMLSAEQPDRIKHNEIRDRFGLHDMIVVGQVNTQHEHGVFNPESLAAHYVLTRAIEQMEGVIARDLMSMAAVDNVEQAGVGTIAYDWLIPAPPQTQQEADRIRMAVERLPMYQGTLVSEDGQAAALFVPLESKDISHRISMEIQAVVEGLGVADEFHITGQPVAQDTFGVEMFQQMAISAPLAGLVIFLAMLYFFRSLPLVVAPMLLAMATVISTMGLLIGMGYTVHIMSSMIPIFLMPIAVVASVHVLSNFADRYRPGDDPKEVMGDVMDKLFKPVLFTALTSAVGFLSLLTTPIPPVQVFGGFISFGVVIALLLTLGFIPAYTVSLKRETLDKMAEKSRQKDLADQQANKDGGLLGKMGLFPTRKPGVVIALVVAVLAVSVYGIRQIQINDNPTLWFKEDHRIRIADKVLNERFSGTYEAYINLRQTGIDRQVDELRRNIQLKLGEAESEGLDLRSTWNNLWNESAGAASPGDRLETLAMLIDDEMFTASFDEQTVWEEILEQVEAGRTATRAFQNPSHLAWMDELKEHLESTGMIGKANSLADLVKTINRELVSGEMDDYRLPERANGVAQTILSFQSSQRPDDLWSFVTRDFTQASIWLQLPSGDNQVMSQVVDAVDRFVVSNPPPEGVELDWGGGTYINLVWQDEMVEGMLWALGSAFIVVLIMMVALFRSVLLGVLAMLPLTITIAAIYGVMGLVGKDYDMPVAVLSSLSLGLSVDFAIHFIQRLRMALDDVGGDWKAAMDQVFDEPARAIVRNAVVIAVGFLPLLAAPLVPYITVGFFLASIMATSALVSLFVLPAFIALAPRAVLGKAVKS